MSVLPRITELILGGYAPAEIGAQFPALKASSIKVYIRKVSAEFTPEQREQARAALKQRGATKTRRKFADQPPISLLHLRIGRRLTKKRLELRLGHTDFCDKFEFGNRMTLAAMERGIHDFTLTELFKIAEMLELSLLELLPVPVSGVTPL